MRQDAMTDAGERVEIGLKKILFATDFSPGAERAASYALALAQHHHSELDVVHVVDLSAGFKTPDAGICIDVFRRSGEENLARTKAQLASAGVQVEAVLMEGLDTARTILHVARDREADLIIAGTRGQGGIARLALGSVAEQLIHHAPCPVLTAGPKIRPHGATEPFRQIVGATDFSPEATAAVRFGLAFAQSWKAHMFLCHVLPPPHDVLHMDGQQLMEQFNAQLQALIPDVARKWCDPECVVDHGYAADGILLLAHRVKADLILLGSHHSSHWLANLKGGIAFEVIRRANCPVLTFPAKQ